MGLYAEQIAQTPLLDIHRERLLAQHMRTSDLCCRYGGEEFCCILPETNLEQALVTAERFRQAVADYSFRCMQNNIKLTISLGVSSMGAETSTAEMLLKKADEGLYLAKSKGRNRTEAVR